jgi:excisionase family DNA binding protein
MSGGDHGEIGNLYTPNEVAKVLGVSYDTILNLVKKGKLKSIRIGPRLIRIKKSSVEELINETKISS